MKFLHLLSFLACISCYHLYSSETLNKTIESLKSTAAQVYMLQKVQEQTIEEVISLPIDIRTALAAQYLMHKGYVEVISLTSNSVLYLKKDFVERKTSFFKQTGNEAVDHYRPTKHKNNPFIRKPKKNGKPQFAYTIQEKANDYWSEFHDKTTDKSYIIEAYGVQVPTITVGPSQDKRFALIKVSPTFLKDQSICFYHTVDDDVFLNHKMDPTTSFSHSKKNGRGAAGNGLVDGFLIWWCGPEQRPYTQDEWHNPTYDNVTCIAMDADTDTFYSGTSSGKLFSYFQFTDHEEIRRHGGYYMQAKPFPVNLKTPIDDIELSDDKEVLWVLSNNCIYTYTLKTEQLTRCLELPTPPTDELLEEQEPETMKVIRTTPYPTIVLVGGSQGTVYLVDTEDNNCYILDTLEEKQPVEDMWWSDTNQVVLLNRSGNIRYCTLSIAKPSTFFVEQEEDKSSPYTIYKKGQTEE